MLRKIVSDFVFFNCQMRTPYKHAALVCALKQLEYDGALQFNVTGSVAELYIKPPVSCIGDVDGMFCCPTKILAASRKDRINHSDLFASTTVSEYLVYEKCPAYVTLSNHVLSNDFDKDDLNHGPARKRSTSPVVTNETYLRNLQHVDSDAVFSIRCPVWPEEAESWRTRMRQCEWPPTSTITNIVNGGCDLVHIAHPDCRQESQDNSQWRFSFSRAEVILTNSWTDVQQTVYHMLRVILKHHKDVSSVNAGLIISNYNLKTVMLWACEKYSSDFWTSDVIDACSRLLLNLGQQVENRDCPHYFISGCNLLGHQLDDIKVLETERYLKRIADPTVLARWFMQNYIKKAFCNAELLTENLEACLNELSSNDTSFKGSNINDVYNSYLKHEFKKYAYCHILEIGKSERTEIVMCCKTILSEFSVSGLKQHYGDKWLVAAETYYSEKWFLKCLTELENFDKKFSECLLEIFLMWMTSRVKVADGWGDYFWEISSLACAMFTRSISTGGRYSDLCSKHTCSLVYFDRAVRMMECILKETSATHIHVIIAVSKRCLLEARLQQDSYSDSIWNISKVYLLLLQYATKHYRCIDLSKTREKCHPCTEMEEILQNIDESDTNFDFLFTSLLSNEVVGEQPRHCSWKVFAQNFQSNIIFATHAIDRYTTANVGTDADFLLQDHTVFALPVACSGFVSASKLLPAPFINNATKTKVLAMPDFKKSNVSELAYDALACWRSKECVFQGRSVSRFNVTNTNCFSPASQLLGTISNNTDATNSGLNHILEGHSSNAELATSSDSTKSAASPLAYSSEYVDDRDDIIKLLTESAIKHLTDLHFFTESFVAMPPGPVSEYYAMYLYKQGDYLSALNECRMYFTKQVEDWHGGSMLYFSEILFDLYDDEIICVFGINRLVDGLVGRSELDETVLLLPSMLFMIYLLIQCMMALDTPVSEFEKYFDVVVDLKHNLYNPLAHEHLSIKFCYLLYTFLYKKMMNMKHVSCKRKL